MLRSNITRLGCTLSEQFEIDELQAFKHIAETINKSTELDEMLVSVLKTLIELTGLQAGWIFLIDSYPHFELAADYGLPTALQIDEKQLIRVGNCWCLQKYWKGELTDATNTINCKRLDDARTYSWGDTEGITHHATIPLTSGSRSYGLLNIAAPGKRNFTTKELTVLESIAYQIGAAIERITLFRCSKQRADQLYKLGELTKALGGYVDIQRIPELLGDWMNSHFQCSLFSFYMMENGQLLRKTAIEHGQVCYEQRPYSPNRLEDGIRAAMKEGVSQIRKTADKAACHKNAGRVQQHIGKGCTSISVPINVTDRVIGVLHVSSMQADHFVSIQVELLELLAEYIALSYENDRLYRKRMKLLKMEERNRLARDLHDSVSQKLFALKLTASGIEHLLPDVSDHVKPALANMQELTADALDEMRSLIWQLRPSGLEEGLLTGLFQYGKRQGLVVLTSTADTLFDLSCGMEETLFRIGQEALNNVRKHARTTSVHIRIEACQDRIRFEVRDEGIGMSKAKLMKLGRSSKYNGIGVQSMQERAELIGGTLMIQSEYRKGTTIVVTLPKVIVREENQNGNTNKGSARG
ncbi:GAF domain-containing sensor histidine kinase [Paenibacillus sp. 481]|uniref:GAF domain-containing sensor histidine kinase n=1 Tax=Paenibacillus sp. 481 TaxID=2835869 RepID=UPI001E5F7F25|nr:GAF domain-containing sensor histidine kinase [Paenibacillus sp. 481]UHA73803.1 GAF domain-containing sensor histidine kinase [Paenibacillus sp. 481]